MGCCHLTEGQRKCAFGSSSVPLIMAIICYTIVMGVGWVLAIRDTPGQPLILAGAVVSTIPVLFLVSYLRFAFTFCKEHKDNSYIRFGIITIHSCAGLVQMIGAALFIAAGANPVDLSAFFLGTVCWRVWYDCWILFYLFSMLLFHLHMRRSRCNIQLL